ncbi:nectin 1a [Misgurnus anguillicaudatus]|uniref:nectin 1a n=1 Tax=Misgurnus anguillicaudatus TaxID=75329 RepID=UPI003CCF342C
MDFFITVATYKVILMCIIQGTNGLTIHHYNSTTAVKGENISLPCIVDEQENVNIIQTEWIKQKSGDDQKIAVFHPLFPIQYHKNGFVVEGRKSSTGKLRGSVLNLIHVTLNDSGNYICEMTSFPFGSIKRLTKVYVTEPPVSLEMSSSYEFVKEGDEVKMRCSASPRPLRYVLQRSKDESFLLKSLSGEFNLPNITRNNSDLYVCLPQWDSSDQHQQGFNATMRLTVNFLDSIECNTSSPLRVNIGEDVTISCKTKASQPLLYQWIKGNTTVAGSDTLSLSSVTSDHSGTYRLTAAFHNNQLQTHMDLSIHVLPGSTTETTSSPTKSFSTSYLNQTTNSLINFTSNSWSTDATVTTSQSGHFLTNTTQPNATMTTDLARHTSDNSPFNGSSFAPPVGNASTSHPYFLNSTSTSYPINMTATDPATRSTTVTFVSENKDTTVTVRVVIIEQDSKRVSYIVIPILLLLLVLILLLYKRHITQKKMDMPPPFKPPPPPVKYTSVRVNDIRMTDI